MEPSQTDGCPVLLTCKVCTIKRAKYTCPRCRINYCSLACYRDRRHGKCSERFYRECCENAVRSLGVDDKTRQQVERMMSLTDCNGYDHSVIESSDESSSEDELTELSERFKDVDLTSKDVDFDQVWNLLSAEEKRDFHRQLVNGSIYAAMPIWTPWWQSTAKKMNTSFPDDFVDSVLNESHEEIQPLSKLLSTEPHPSIIYSLAETLMGFAFVSRYYNGDHLVDMQTDACYLLLELVSYLHSGVTRATSRNKTRIINCSMTTPIIFANFTEVVASLQSNLSRNHLTCSHKLLLLLTDDLHCLLQEADLFLVRAFREIKEMLSAVKTKDRTVAPARRKVQFLLACVGKSDGASANWCRKYVSALFDEVEVSMCEQTVLIESERRRMSPREPDGLKGAGPNWRNIIRDNPNPKPPLIEEIHPHLVLHSNNVN